MKSSHGDYIFFRSTLTGQQFFWYLLLKLVFGLCESDLSLCLQMHFPIYFITQYLHFLQSIFPISNHPGKAVVLSLSFKCNASFF